MEVYDERPMLGPDFLGFPRPDPAALFLGLLQQGAWMFSVAFLKAWPVYDFLV